MRNLLDHYLLALRHEAHRSFPADRAEEIVTEVRTHLEDRVDANVRDGIARPLAESDALRDFGPARKLVNGFLDAAYETPFARRARLIAFCLVALIAVALAFCHWGTSPDTFAMRYPVPLPRWFGYVASFGILVLIVGGVLGRRPQTKQYALVWCGAACLVALQVGTKVANLNDAVPGAKVEWGIPRTIHRDQLERARQISEKHLRLAEREANLLRAGVQAFVHGKGDTVPESLKRGSDYIYPVKGAPGLRRPAFGKQLGKFYIAPRLVNSHYSLGFRTQADALRPYTYRNRAYSPSIPIQLDGVQTKRISEQEYRRLQEELAAMTASYTRNQWIQYGPRWLTAKTKAIQREKWLLSAYAAIEQSSGFNTGAVLHRVPLWCLPALGWLVLLVGTDYLAALFGRFLLRLRREWEWRITAARVR